MNRHTAACRVPAAAEEAEAEDGLAEGKQAGASCLRDEVYAAVLKDVAAGLRAAQEHVRGPDGQLPAALCTTSTCGKIWKDNAMIVKCSTCQVDQTCAICLECFDSEQHAGHDWRISNSGSGMCDCGDPTAWDPKFFCKRHKGQTMASDPLQDVDPAVVRRVSHTVEGVVMAVAEATREATVPRDSFPPDVVARCVPVLTAWAKGGDGMARIVSKTLCDKIDTADFRQSPYFTICEDRHEELKALIAALVTDGYMRKCLGIHYCRQIMRKDAKRRQLPIADMSIQFLTNPFVVQLVQYPDESIERPGLFHAMLTALHFRRLEPLTDYRGIRFSLKLADGRTEVNTATKLKDMNENSLVALDVHYALQTNPKYGLFCFETKILREMIFMHLLHLQQSFASYRIDDDDNARHYADYENSLHELCSTTLVDSLKGCASPEALAPAFFDLFRYAEPFLKHSLSRDSDPTLAWLCLHSPYKTCTHGVYFCLPLHRLYGMMVRTLVTKFPEAPAAAYLAENMKRNAFHHFAEHPLGLFVTRGQVLANMWRRDNMGIAQLSEWWARVPRLASSIRHDFVVVQLEAALGPSSAACHIAHRFSAHQPLLQDTQEREHNIIEFFFRFVLSLATDFSCYSSDVKETLKDSLRHSLALGPKKFSELSELQDRDELEAAEQCLLDVAEVVRREENAQFRLKDGMWPTINPYSALWEERKLVKADAEYAKLKARHSLLPCKVPENPPPCMAPAVGLLCAEVVLATAVAAIRDAATMPWVTENVVRKALDVLHLALRTSELYATVYGAVQKPENAFLASRRDMAAALVPQDVISWEIAEDRQPDVAAMLTKPNAAGRVPVSYAVDLLKVSRLKELHAPVHDVLDLLRKASPEAREAVELAAKVLVQAKEKDGAATAKENKMAKALARQKAALAKMQKKQTELVLDDFSDEGEADAGDAGDDGASRPSCHDLLDVAWLQDKECTFCGMTVSPNGQTDVALIAQVARGNALQKCFQKERADCPAKKGKVSADEDEDEVLEHSLCSVRTLFDGGACHVHTCGHIAHLDCCSSHMKHIRQASRLTQAHLDSFSVYKGQGIISLALNEFMCPLCSRIANSLCPLVNPTNAKKSKARTVPFVKLMSELPSDDDVNRSESDLVEVFDSFVEDSEACGVAKMEEDTFYQVAVETFAGRVSDAVFRRWRPHTSRATDRKGGAKLGWAHQCAAIEISTRTSDVRQVSLTKLTNLRAQLKATVAAEESCDADILPLKSLLRGAESLKPLLTLDIFAVWVYVVLGVALRSEEVGYAGYQFLLKRALEAQLTKLVAELVYWGSEVPEEVKGVESLLRTHAEYKSKKTASTSFEPKEHLEREMAIVLSWMLIADRAIRAPLGSEYLTLPNWRTGSPRQALEDAAKMLNLPSSYHSIEGLAEAIEAREGEPGSISVWGEKLQQRARLVRAPTQSHFVFKLIGLPKDYIALMNKYHLVPAQCGLVPNKPVLCLTCGEIICLVCECNQHHKPIMNHSRSCGGGSSVFMHLKSTSTIVITEPRTGELPSMYVDSYGESDIELRRGRFLQLSETRYERYEELQAFSMFSFDTACIASMRLTQIPLG